MWLVNKGLQNVIACERPHVNACKPPHNKKLQHLYLTLSSRDLLFSLMKPIQHIIVLLCTVFCFVVPPNSHSAVGLSGSWAYDFYGYNYWFQRGAPQSGRVRNIGKGYYDFGYFGASYSGSNSVFNNSRSEHSGKISLELWQTKTYGGSSGFLKMCRGFDSLRPKFEYTGVSSGNGYAWLTYRYGYYVVQARNYKGGWKQGGRINFTSGLWDY